MIELGKRQKLEAVHMKEFGVYPGEHEGDEAAVLLPKKQVPRGTKLGGELEVFIYKDSEDRLVAITGMSRLQVGGVAVLEVKEVGKIGVFLDTDLEKGLLLLFKGRNRGVCQGEDYLVALCIDEGRRLAATVRVYPYMNSEPPYQEDNKVIGTAYELNENLGVFVVVDNRYCGLVPEKELYGNTHEGDIITARVMKVRDDGKLGLSPREKAYVQMDMDSKLVLKVIDESGDVLPSTDRANPETIKREFNMSKNASKRAAGHLLKESKTRITEKAIGRVQEISLGLGRIS